MRPLLPLILLLLVSHLNIATASPSDSSPLNCPAFININMDKFETLTLEEIYTSQFPEIDPHLFQSIYSEAEPRTGIYGLMQLSEKYPNKKYQNFIRAVFASKLAIEHIRSLSDQVRTLKLTLTSNSEFGCSYILFAEEFYQGILRPEPKIQFELYSSVNNTNIFYQIQLQSNQSKLISIATGTFDIMTSFEKENHTEDEDGELQFLKIGRYRIK